MSWREEFHRAVGDWLERTLPVRRPFGDWRPVATILSIKEELDYGNGSPTTPVNTEVLLTIAWLDDAGEQHVISEYLMLTDLMKELT